MYRVSGCQENRRGETGNDSSPGHSALTLYSCVCTDRSPDHWQLGSASMSTLGPRSLTISLRGAQTQTQTQTHPCNWVRPLACRHRSPRIPLLRVGDPQGLPPGAARGNHGRWVQAGHLPYSVRQVRVGASFTGPRSAHPRNLSGQHMLGSERPEGEPSLYFGRSR